MEDGAQSRLGRVAKEMCLWALERGSPVLRSHLYFLLIVCPGAFPLPHCLCLCPSACPPALLHGAGSFTAFTVQVNTPLLERNHSVEFTSPAPGHCCIALSHCLYLYLVVSCVPTCLLKFDEEAQTCQSGSQLGRQNPKQHWAYRRQAIPLNSFFTCKMGTLILCRL